MVDHQFFEACKTDPVCFKKLANAMLDNDPAGFGQLIDDDEEEESDR
jgi:hypothetical protein